MVLEHDFEGKQSLNISKRQFGRVQECDSMSEQQGTNIDDRERKNMERYVLEHVPAALVLTDLEQTIQWCNPLFCRWVHDENPVGQKIFSVLGRPTMRGPDFVPFSKVRGTGLYSMTVLEMHIDPETRQFLRMGVGPIFGDDGKVIRYVVYLHDVTERVIQDEKWIRLREAGRELADLSKKDILQRSPKERTSILRAKIAKYIQEILKFTAVEIRVCSEREPLLLEPLFAFGFPEDARLRMLYVSQDENGITGWVAYHGKSYKMDDSNEDPFFIEGIAGGRSSLTVPLMCRGEVIGTFNVESQQPNAFDDNDMQLLEAFANDVAQAIHTLELLSVEQKETAFRSIEKVFSDSIGPLNLILNETACLPLEELRQNPAYINFDDIVMSVTRVREYARQIQAAFQGHIASLAPDLSPELSATDCNNYPMLRNRRVLMVDSDESVGKELSRILFYYGSTVETSTSGFGALKMLETTHYDVVLSDIKLPDMSAFTFFKRVRCIFCKRFQNRPLDTICEPPEEDPCCPSAGDLFIPFIYMRGFGYDSAHVTTRASQAGVTKIIFKPFIVAQLLDTLKAVILKAEQQKENV
ncbi:MAG: GAF domain-containing protein [Planctomycetaceae bacterium]|jgi:GAF domain-containing protein|nr:GAF domain-containing protein [Planctomycetaceae bacterium]